MDVNKAMLRQYIETVAINLGHMDQDVANSIRAYNKDTFDFLLKARIKYLQDKSESASAFFPPEYYLQGIETVSRVLNNLDSILAEAP